MNHNLQGLNVVKGNEIGSAKIVEKRIPVTQFNKLVSEVKERMRHKSIIGLQNENNETSKSVNFARGKDNQRKKDFVYPIIPNTLNSLAFDTSTRTSFDFKSPTKLKAKVRNRSVILSSKNQPDKSPEFSTVDRKYVFQMNESEMVNQELALSLKKQNFNKK